MKGGWTRPKTEAVKMFVDYSGFDSDDKTGDGGLYNNERGPTKEKEIVGVEDSSDDSGSDDEEKS